MVWARAGATGTAYSDASRHRITRHRERGWGEGFWSSTIEKTQGRPVVAPDSSVAGRTLEEGQQIAMGVDPQAYLASQRSVAECYYTAAAASALARKIGVEMPITENVYAVLHEGRPLADAVRMLLERAYKDELAGIEIGA